MKGYYKVVKAFVGGRHPKTFGVEGQVLKDPPPIYEPFVEKITKAEFDALSRHDSADG